MEMTISLVCCGIRKGFLIWNRSSHLCPESSLDEFAWDFECGHECAALRDERFSRTGFIFFKCFSCEGKLLEDCEGVHAGYRLGILDIDIAYYAKEDRLNTSGELGSTGSIFS